MASKLGKSIGAAAAVLGGGLLLSTCDPVVSGVAELLAGGQPEMPARTENVSRANVDLGIGIDATKSRVVRQLGPIVLPATNEALGSNMFNDGDEVRLCKIGGPNTGDTTCDDFEMNIDLDALQTKVSGIKGDGDFTQLKGALRAVVSDLEAPCSAVVWTDAINEDTGNDRVDARGCDINLLIPDASYRDSADELCSFVDGNCEVVLAQTGKDVEGVLRGVFDELQRDAQAEADIVNAQIEADYQRALSEYDADKEALQGKADKLKKIARISLLSITGLLSAIMASLILYVTRPKCTGTLYIRTSKTGRRPKVRQMPLERFDSSTIDLAKEGAKFGISLPPLTLKSARNGNVNCHGMPLSGVVQLDDDVFYSSDHLSKKDPRYKEIVAKLTGSK